MSHASLQDRPSSVPQAIRLVNRRHDPARLDRPGHSRPRGRSVPEPSDPPGLHRPGHPGHRQYENLPRPSRGPGDGRVRRPRNATTAREGSGRQFLQQPRLRRVSRFPRVDRAPGHRRHPDHHPGSLASADRAGSRPAPQAHVLRKADGLEFSRGPGGAAAVHANRVVFQFGTQQRSGGNFRFACELVRNQRSAGSKPSWSACPGASRSRINPPSPCLRSWITSCGSARRP
jgi:hypothetical protein